jgi:hypothetical protein
MYTICRLQEGEGENFKALSDILIKLKMEFNAVLETLLAVEIWSDE